jgi:hypothetical protein
MLSGDIPGSGRLDSASAPARWLPFMGAVLRPEVRAVNLILRALTEVRSAPTTKEGTEKQENAVPHGARTRPWATPRTSPLPARATTPRGYGAHHCRNRALNVRP